MAKASLAFDLNKSLSEINDLPMNEIGTLLAYKVLENERLNNDKTGNT